jgi:hypothetical protein
MQTAPTPTIRAPSSARVLPPPGVVDHTAHCGYPYTVHASLCSETQYLNYFSTVFLRLYHAPSSFLASPIAICTAWCAPAAQRKGLKGRFVQINGLGTDRSVLRLLVEATGASAAEEHITACAGQECPLGRGSESRTSLTLSYAYQ